MRAIQLEQPQQFRVIDVPEPPAPGPGEAVVRVARVCVCGLRRLFTVPARKLHISRKLTFEQLALVETLAIGCHAIYRGAPKPDETLLVIGAGPIGLSVIEFAKLSGARTAVTDINEQR